MKQPRVTENDFQDLPVGKARKVAHVTNAIVDVLWPLSRTQRRAVLSQVVLTSIEFRPTKQVRGLLEKLLATGLYGFRIEDVVERLICDSLVEMLKERSVLLGLAQKRDRR